MSKNSDMNILVDQTDVHGNKWRVIFVFNGICPDWAWESDGVILSWSGFENAVGWQEEE